MTTRLSKNLTGSLLKRNLITTHWWDIVLGLDATDGWRQKILKRKKSHVPYAVKIFVSNVRMITTVGGPHAKKTWKRSSKIGLRVISTFLFAQSVRQKLRKLKVVIIWHAICVIFNGVGYVVALIQKIITIHLTLSDAVYNNIQKSILGIFRYGSILDGWFWHWLQSH